MFIFIFSSCKFHNSYRFDLKAALHGRSMRRQTTQLPTRAGSGAVPSIKIKTSVFWADDVRGHAPDRRTIVQPHVRFHVLRCTYSLTSFDDRTSTGHMRSLARSAT